MRTPHHKLADNQVISLPAKSNIRLFIFCDMDISTSGRAYLFPGYIESNDIGIPQSIRFINNGTFYFKDDSIQSYYEAPQILTLSNFELDSS